MANAVKTVAITGSSGYLGAAVAEHLKAQGYVVIGIDKLPGAFTSHVIDLAMDHKGVREALKQALTGVNAVIHLAALHAPHVGHFSRQAFVEVNVLATLQLLELAAELGISRLVFASSTSVYGHALSDPLQAVWIDEQVIPQPRDIYDITKLAAEQLCVDVAKECGLQIPILRVARCFPESAAQELWYRTHRGVGLSDVSQGFQCALETDTVQTCRIYNLCAPSPFSKSDLGVLKRQPEAVMRERCSLVLNWFEQANVSMLASIDRVYSCQRAMDEIGYRPQQSAPALAHQWLNQ